MIPAGTIIRGPNGQSYEVAQDLLAHSSCSAKDFIAHGGAAEPMEGARMPIWLFNHISSHFSKELARG